MNTEVTKFKVGEQYVTRFACDADTKIYCVIVGRTDKSVKVSMDGKIQTKRVRNHMGTEIFHTASYSMAPIFSADRIVSIASM